MSRGFSFSGGQLRTRAAQLPFFAIAFSQTNHNSSNESMDLGTESTRREDRRIFRINRQSRRATDQCSRKRQGSDFYRSRWSGGT